MMRQLHRLLFVLLLLGLLPAMVFGQSFQGTINGTVTDPSAGAVAGAEVTLTNVDQKSVAKVTTNADGLFSFPNLKAGNYELSVTAQGFREYVQRGISLAINQIARQDVKLEVGQQAQVIEVTANVATLNYDNAVREDSITPQALAELPLLVAGGPRSSATFAILMPGVSTGANSNAFDARINGGLQSGDEAIMDGITMQEGFMSQNGMVSIFQDFPLTPDMVSEMKVMASNYEPQYGSTLSAAIVAVTKSGTSEYHGGGYEYHRNSILNARPFGSAKRPRDLENDYGFYLGGPAIPYPVKKVPGIYSDKHKSYFYVNYEAFRIAGGVNQPRATVPTVKMRNGDFSEWVDSNGKLIPIFDPATVRNNPNFNSGLPESATNLRYLKNQFMGCDGNSPNVICATDPRLTSSLSQAYLKYVPLPSQSGLTNNWIAPTPVPDSILAQTNYWLFKGDHYWGDKDHFAATIWYQGAPAKFASMFPQPIATESMSFPQFSFVNRFNWDHTFSPTLLNHVAYGYLNRNEGYGAVNRDFVGEFPQPTGVPKHDVPPGIGIDGYSGYSNGGSRGGPNNTTARPTNVVNDLLTWVKGKHTLKFGGELRFVDGSIRSDGGQSGNFSFGNSATGLPVINSGNGYASFLLGAVTSANYTLYTLNSVYARQRGYIWHVGDTWKVTPKLSLNLGLRWDYYTPMYEKYNHLAFFDPNGANAAAGGRSGVVKWAGDQWGAASYGARYPEKPWKKGFAPRVGIAYTINDKTVVRAGYGIYYSQAFYPDWGGGMNSEGFNSGVTKSATEFGGYKPAFYWQDGFPAPSADQIPPFINSSRDNGRGVYYRQLEANRLPYAQQWNLTIERQLTKDMMLSVAYVANKGTRIPSSQAAINTLDPKYLSMGAKLGDQFQPGMTSLNGVNIPYAGWVEQMGKDCNPTVAQALLPYPQYCGSIQGMNEAAGNSNYHSFQAKLEKRFSNGLSILTSYTFSKLITSASDNTQRSATTWSGQSGSISPFERQRNKSLATDDVPQVLSVAVVYDLPFGKGRQFMSQGGVVNAILGGWQISSVFRKSSGIPYYFRSGACNIPGQFGMACIPSTLKDPFLQDPGNWDVNKPLFDKTAFQGWQGNETPVTFFRYYQGNGPRISNYRGASYQNQDFALTKEINIAERVKVQLYGQFFNMWNWHIFNGTNTEWGNNSVNTDINSVDFGKWNGAVTNPRNIQLGLRISF